MLVSSLIQESCHSTNYQTEVDRKDVFRTCFLPHNNNYFLYNSKLLFQLIHKNLKTLPGKFTILDLFYYLIDNIT